MQALLARRYTQVEKLLFPWKEERPRQALRKVSWARSRASSRFPVIRRHRVYTRSWLSSISCSKAAVSPALARDTSSRSVCVMPCPPFFN